MINKAKRWLVGCVVLAFGASCQMFAQDGLDALLRDLKGDGEEAAAPAVAADQPAALEAPAALAADDDDAPAPVLAAPAAVREAVAAALPDDDGDDALAAARAKFAGAAVTDADDALIAELKMLEELRRRSLDEHGVQSLDKARALLQTGDNTGAVEQYKQALEFLIKRPANDTMRQAAETEMAEAYYREAVQLAKRYDNDAAKAAAQEAQQLGHPKAARLLATIVKERSAPPISPEKITHQKNDKVYQANQDEIRKRLRKSRQHFVTAEFEKALEECELVLRDYPSNVEAIALRKAIAVRLDAIAEDEREATRAMMMKEINEAWTPDRYAMNSTQPPKGKKEMSGRITSTAGGRDPTKTQSQIVNSKLRSIIIPEVSFRPPATIIDAVDFFKQASRDYDDQEIPIDLRGVNLILKLPTATDAPASDDVFAPAGGGGGAGIPVISAMTARNISLYDALKLVCEVTGMKTRVSGNIVMIVPVGEPDKELVRRSYNVLPSLPDRLDTASSQLTPRGAGGGNERGFMDVTPMGNATGQEADWKKFFGEMGVAWPTGSSISYALGKLRVTNTEDNLAVFEQMLEELNVTEKLVEIEARFVEVSQDDLNSLGFEWLINGDYSFSVPGFARNILGLKDGISNVHSQLTDVNGTPLWADQAMTTPLVGYLPYTKPGTASGYGWGKGPDGLVNLKPITGGQYGTKLAGRHNAMVNAIDGTTYSTGHRYLNTANNPIIGQNVPINDQFMKLNAFVGGADVSMILHMLSQRSDTDLLSAPKVTVSPDQEAIIKVVTEYIYPSEFNVQISQQGTSSGSMYGGGSGEPLAIVEPQNFTMREVGVILQVIPKLSEDGSMITLSMRPQVVSEPVWKNYGTRIPRQTVVPANTLNPLDSGSVTTEYIELPMEQPFFNVRSVETQLTINNGATVVMGGLITESRTTIEDKIPLLGDIPFLGRLFRSRAEQTSKRNLLIFVTAKTLGSDGRQPRSGGDTFLGADAGGSTVVMPADDQ